MQSLSTPTNDQVEFFLPTFQHKIVTLASPICFLMHIKALTIGNVVCLECWNKDCYGEPHKVVRPDPMVKIAGTASLRSVLGCAALLVLLPSLAVAVLLVIGSAHLQQRAVEEGLHVRARSLAAITDIQVRDLVTDLDVIALSPSIDAAQPDAFRAAAERHLSQHAGWQALALFDASGRLRFVVGSTPVQTVTAFAGRGLAGEGDSPLRVLSQTSPDGQTVIGFAVPVRRAGSVKGTVVAIVPARNFRPILTDYDARQGAQAGIIDRTGLVVAASDGTMVGQAWPYLPAGRVPEDGEPQVTRATVGGMPAYIILARSTVAPWNVAYVLPATLVEAPLALSRLLIGALVLLLFVPVMFILLLGHFLGRQIRTLSTAADAVAHERALPASAPSRLREIAAVQQALQHATEVVQERSLARERLRMTELSLERLQRLESVGQLATGIAHDFGGYLFTIHGNLELIKSATAGNTQVQHLVEPALSLSDEAVRLVQQLSSLARRRSVGLTRINMNDVLQEISELLRHVAGRAVQVEIQTAPHLWDCQFGPLQLQSALVNLVANARDAMPSGGSVRIDTRNLTLTAERAAALGVPSAGRYVALSVADTGVGMSPETVAHVFEPFFTTKPEGSGSGIGLTVLSGSISAAGGHLAVESTVGVGTTFTILLPQATIPTNGAAIPAAQNGSDASSACHS